MAYSDEVLADSPYVYLRLNETSGTTAADSSGNNRPGDYVGAWTLGIAGALVNSPSTAAQIPTNAGTGVYMKGAQVGSVLTGTGSFSVETWHKPPNTTTASLYVVHNRSIAGSGSFINFLVSWTTSKYTAGRSDGSTRNTATSSRTYSTNTWNHVVATYDGTTCRLYVNGILEGTAADTRSLAFSSAAPIVIGNSGDFNTPLASASLSSFDEVAFYNTVLSPARIAAHYLAGVDKFSAYASEVLADTPAGYWRLDETTGTAAADSSGNGRNGTYNSVTLGNTGIAGGKAISSNGASSYMDTNIAQNSLTVATYEAWVKASALPAATCGIFGTTVSTYGRHLTLLTSGVLRVTMYNAVSGTQTVTGSVNICDGQWHHVVAHLGSSINSVRIYVDGTLDVQGSGITLNSSSTARLSAGLAFGSYMQAGVLIDEAAIYTGQLSAARITAHWDAGKGTAYTGLGTVAASVITNGSGGLRAGGAASVIATVTTLAYTDNLYRAWSSLTVDADIEGQGVADYTGAGTPTVTVALGGKGGLRAGGAGNLTASGTLDVRHWVPIPVGPERKVGVYSQLSPVPLRQSGRIPSATPTRSGSTQTTRERLGE